MANKHFIPDDQIGITEIIKQLNTTKWYLSQLRNKITSDMPKPVNTNNKFMLYNRADMQAWIDKCLAAKAAEQAKKQTFSSAVTGLDNTMASAFLRSKHVS